MERALWTSVTGMKSQDLMMDNIANNLANVNTVGYKASRVNFQDLLYSALVTPGATSGATQVPTGIQIGHGTKVAAIAKQYSQGALKETGNPLDLALEGDGFFEITLPDGTLAYTRDGSFKMNSSGQIITNDGYTVNGFDAIDQGTTEINIMPDGSFSAIVNGSQIQKTQVSLTRFPNPEGLRAIGRNLYIPTEASGAALTGNNPGVSGTATIQQKYLETSNVKVVEELVSMITAQRAYEASSKSIKAADEMLQEANNLRR